MNKKIGLGIVGVVVLAGVFYGGMVYGKSQIPVQVMGTFSRNGAFGNGGGGRNGAGFTSGKIISKDATSITVQLMTGGTGSTASGSKIIFLDGNTKVLKQAIGTLADLAVGTEVSVTGTPNADGSVNATAVQIRPANPSVLK